VQNWFCTALLYNRLSILSYCKYYLALIVVFLHFIFLLPQFPHFSPSAPQHYDYTGLFIALTVLQHNRTAEINEYGELELKDFELAVRKKVLKNVLNCCQHVKTL
jgi:hypothetical protein